MKVNGKHYRTVWLDGGTVKMINQPLLPHRFEVFECPTHRDTAEAIRTMVVRGAGAIGTAAGYGMAQAALEAADADPHAFLRQAAETLRRTRPTAQNLFYAIDRVLAAVDGVDDPAALRRLAVAEAQAISDEDAEAARRIGEYGEPLIRDGATVLTHCNAGWLAFADWGTALSPVYAAVRAGKTVRVLADETRPRSQGARLTAWELMAEGVDVTIIADNAAGHYLSRGQVDLVITGADRIAANGDVANKIGTYEKAVLAHAHGVPFYVAAPRSTFDSDCSAGTDIPIEQRCGDEVLYAYGWTDEGEWGRVRIAPPGAKAGNPAFDVTPARYITGLITEVGVVPATVDAVAEMLARP
jgi:methylthioribose-1-phosphate isomerase